MDWKTMVAYVTGSVDAELLRRHEYLVAENRILRAHISDREEVRWFEEANLSRTAQNRSGGSVADCPVRHRQPRLGLRPHRRGPRQPRVRGE